MFRGTITGKYVIYRGMTAKMEDLSEKVTYLNVEEYLKSL